MIKVFFEMMGDDLFLFDDLTTQKEIELFLAATAIKYVTEKNIKRMELRPAMKIEVDPDISLSNDFVTNDPDLEFFTGENLEDCYVFECLKACGGWKYAVIIKKVEDPIEVQAEKYLTHESPIIRKMAKDLG